MGAVPAQALACGIWSPPDVLGVRGYSGQRPRWVRQPMLTSDKTSLRVFLRNNRKDFVSKRLSPNFQTASISQRRLDDVIAKARVVAGYMAVGSEADLIDIMTSYASRGTKWCLPWLADRDAPMLFRSWSPGQPTELAPGGFRQPLSSSPVARPGLILLPLLGFDRSGNRLGQGAGHYDRALALMPAAHLVGIAWSVQEVDRLPADPWDVPLDAVVTEAEWIVPAHSRLERD
jgi:5-formyltetrahydrofolate cyclo-ligase